MAINYDEATGNYTDGVTTLSRGESDAYKIGTLDQLKLFRDAVNAGHSFNGKTVKLTASIDLKNEEWTPIGKNGAPFQGTFDGQGNTVSNLCCTPFAIQSCKIFILFRAYILAILIKDV